MPVQKPSPTALDSWRSFYIYCLPALLLIHYQTACAQIITAPPPFPILRVAMAGFTATDPLPNGGTPSRLPPRDLAPFFAPPEQYRSDFGNFRSPLLFADGTRVQTPDDWQRRREEIRSTWHKIMGPWPALIEKPRVETINTK